MSEWEDFEKDCTDYLNAKFSEFAFFERRGGSDSTIPDILVKTKTNKTFYIEAKCCPAQCGQFVLIPDPLKQAFVYSSLNVTKLNSSSSEIINFMNKDFDYFMNAGTTGRDIIMNNGSSVFGKWIKQTYESKNVKMFISNGFKIINIEDFTKHFKVSASYRVKRSGSSPVGINAIPMISAFIQNNYTNIEKIIPQEKKLFVISKSNIHNMRFMFQGYEYMFSAREDMYEVRKLSNTFNANVIFSVDLIKSEPGLTDKEVIDLLQ